MLERPKGAPASGFVQRLRSAFENARLGEATWMVSPGAPPYGALALELVFARGEQREHAIADFDRDAPSLILLGEHGRPLGGSDERALRARLPFRRLAPFQVGRGKASPSPATPLPSSRPQAACWRPASARARPASCATSASAPRAPSSVPNARPRRSVVITN